MTILAHILLIPWRRALKRLSARWRRFVEIVTDPYRPELHYMRGPGPKWHARHRQVAAIPVCVRR